VFLPQGKKSSVIGNKMAENEVLLGLHDPTLMEVFEGFFKRVTEYSTDSVTTYEEMLKKVREKEYKIYIMDLNLGI